MSNITAMKQRLLCWAFARVYRKWLWNEWYQRHDTVLRVLGWRTALVVAGPNPPKDQRRCMTPCFWIFQ